jgi:hypothetical protein
VSEADLGVLRLGGLPFGSLVRRPTAFAHRPAANAAANAGSNAWTIGPGRSATGGRSSPTIRILASAASIRVTSPILSAPGLGR